MKITAFVTGAWILIAGVHAGAANLQHAEFAFDGAAVAAELKKSNVAFTAVASASPTTFYCQAVVSSIGTTEGAACFSKDGREVLADQVAEAVAEQDFWPAHVNGKAVAVRVNFRVVLETKADDLIAAVYPNLGAVQNLYGPNYVEPQERLDSESWYTYFTARRDDNSKPFFAHADAMVRVAAHIETDGKAADVNVIEADNAYRMQAKTVRQGLRQAKFIPGYVQGKPVSMPYLAVVTFEE